MATLKLYFSIISDDLPSQFSVHRELSTVELAWRQANRSASVGILHAGFIRPTIKNLSALLRYRGSVLVTIAAKWALPDDYKSSVAVVAELQSFQKNIPLHQLLRGFGCEEHEPDAGYNANSAVSQERGESIAEAALAVLNDAQRPLNKEEIFARIVEKGLYEFGAKKPVSVLSVQLDRYSEGTQYSKPGIKPLFIKLDGELFCSKARGSTLQSGWVKQLSIDNADLSGLVSAYGIYDEESYRIHNATLPVRLRAELELYRFESRLQTIDPDDPSQLIGILPSSLTNANINSLGLPIRIVNVLNVHSVQSLDELKGVTLVEMLRWPNFGRKSARDFCLCLLSQVRKMSDGDGQIHIENGIRDREDLVENERDCDDAYLIEVVSKTPLKEHFEKALSELKENQRQVIEYRTGYRGSAMTLEEVGELLGVTRERIRQIQKKYVEKIIETEFWDDCIALKIGQLLIDRKTPLFIEMLELEDPWFEGFMGNYQHLAAIIELFSENEIRVVKINGASVVTRIKADAWDQCVSHFRKSLKSKAEEGGWSRHDVEMTIVASLSENSAAELLSLMWEQFETSLQFDGEHPSSKLIGFGKSAEAAVSAVLAKAEKPLHYSEIALRASEIYGREVAERLAQNALPRLGAEIYGRGIYGLAHHNPISDRMCKNIRLIVSSMIQDGPLMKQWHCAEIMNQLKERFPALPEQLDHYILNIILDDAPKLVCLNRMVWARADSGQAKGDRIDLADAFTKILQDSGGPLKGRELKERLSQIRGVVENLQIHPTDEMIQLGPDYWGLIGRDLAGTEEGNSARLDALYHHLSESQVGIHVSEVEHALKSYDIPGESPGGYALLNLAQRDPRFYLAKAMLLGLAEWGGDARRLNLTEAVKRLYEGMTSPLSIGQIHLELGNLTGLSVDSNVSGLLAAHGFVYDLSTKLWFK